MESEASVSQRPKSDSFKKGSRREAVVVYSRPDMIVVEYIPEPKRSIFEQRKGAYRETFTVADLVEKDQKGERYCKIVPVF